MYSLREIFLKAVSTRLPISFWMIYEQTCPHRAERLAIFDQKWHDPHAPPSHFTHSPDPALSKFFLFPWMKKAFKGKHFAHVEEEKQKIAEALRGININEFKNGFDQWKKYLDRCFASNGECFGGD